jgi:hypothetical protein
MTDRLAVAPQALFAYGTLQFPEVLSALLGRVPSCTPVAVPGWRVAALPGRSYPGLVRHSGTATGLLITGLSVPEWRTLDAWEDAFYELRELDLVGDGTAWSWVCPEGYEVEPYDWTPAEFAAAHLPRFTREIELRRADSA